ncbi:hypothetical protein [Alkaliphilus transvaalensis]|uniref:hypothetical protein n=1 Tax=Alkaliphilus transvaalensis TaxID=114628 RepID=UPI000479ABDE|nr:hypothetical protein [Alkaliphilus transvaalensis]
MKKRKLMIVLIIVLCNSLIMALGMTSSDNDNLITLQKNSGDFYYQVQINTMDKINTWYVSNSNTSLTIIENDANKYLLELYRRSVNDHRINSYKLYTQLFFMVCGLGLLVWSFIKNPNKNIISFLMVILFICSINIVLTIYRVDVGESDANYYFSRLAEQQ